MSQHQYDDDPFATRESYPSVSFKDKPVGTRYVMRVVEPPTMVQSRDFETGERATWDDGNPKMSVVTGVEVNGERMSLWAPKPSALFVAIGEAQQQANARIAVGGTMTVEYVGDKPNEKNPRLNPAKQYRVTYSPPDAFSQSAPPDVSSASQSSRPQPGSPSEPPF